MFEPAEHARIFGLPPGTDFAGELLRGLRTRLDGKPPETLARTQIIVNTRRTARRLRDLFDAGPPCLLPRISLVTDIGETWNLNGIPSAAPPLERRLELARLVASLLDREPDIAPRAAIYDLADSLAGLMDEMHGEGVSPDVIDRLDVSDQSGHWARIRTFLNIVRPYFDAGSDRPGTEARQRMVVESLSRLWQSTPPEHPVIVAGSTGSRGATRMLMCAVAQLPQGAVLLPGFDFDTPEDVWKELDDPLQSEDHPQYRFHAFLGQLGLTAGMVRRWTPASPPVPARNKLLSLALRPAPVTDQWLRDGPRLRDIDTAMENVTLLEAPSARQEALGIAMRLRKAAEEEQTAALVTPDRTLTRQVAASLDRWGILPDDSAGQPLHLSPPGRFLRHVADLYGDPVSAAMLLTLLKHPLTHSGNGRGGHLLLTRKLELHLRRDGPPYPGPEDILGWAANQKGDAAAWAAWIGKALSVHDDRGERPLEERVTDHLALAETLASGSSDTGSGTLWCEEAGTVARRAVDALAEAAPHGGPINASDYSALFTSVLSREEVHQSRAAHPGIRIWGTLEARVQGADLLILAGLNEGSWPEPSQPDPWLNRSLRQQAGLLLPERRIGLAAHDFQQAALASEVWLSRSIRSDDAQTVASRWLNRLMNLLDGLPDQGGTLALRAARQRGKKWLSRATILEATESAEPAPRPSPCPPPDARPKQLPVTAIQKLIRDPYHVYARHVLRLRPLDPLMRAPDALLRGTVLHDVLERFIRDTRDTPQRRTATFLLNMAETILRDKVSWAEARILWLARLERVAGWFVETEAQRRARGDPVALEQKGALELSDPSFTLTATADRVDLDPQGRVWIYDYKTGTPPGAKEQKLFDKQLLLEAVMAERSGFGPVAAAPVAGAAFIGLGTKPVEQPVPLEETPTEETLHDFRKLISAYMEHDQGYTSRRMGRTMREPGDFDHLARYGEWDMTAAPRKTRLE